MRNCFHNLELKNLSREPSQNPQKLNGDVEPSQARECAVSGKLTKVKLEMADL
jgi:hypothetical protein